MEKKRILSITSMAMFGTQFLIMPCILMNSFKISHGALTTILSFDYPNILSNNWISFYSALTN